MIQRKEYLDLLKKWKDDQVIKIITGIRRCGEDPQRRSGSGMKRNAGDPAVRFHGILHFHYSYPLWLILNIFHNLSQICVISSQKCAIFKINIVFFYFFRSFL